MVENSSFMKGFTESYLADVGRVIAAWSHVEFSFDMLFLSRVVMKGKSSGSMKDPKVKLMGKSFQQRIRILRECITELEITEEKQKHIKNILDQLLRCRKERDEIAHSLFSPSSRDSQFVSDEAVSIYKSWKNSKEPEFKVVTQAHLTVMFQAMESLYWNLFDLSLDGEVWDQHPRSA